MTDRMTDERFAQLANYGSSGKSIADLIAEARRAREAEARLIRERDNARAELDAAKESFLRGGVKPAWIVALTEGLIRERDEARELVERQAEEVRAVNLGAEDLRRKLDALRAWEVDARAAMRAVGTEDHDSSCPFEEWEFHSGGKEYRRHEQPPCVAPCRAALVRAVLGRKVT